MKEALATGSGNLIIDVDVVAQYAGSVAVECFGIVGMAAVSMSDGIAKMLKKENLTRGINVEMVKNKLVLDFHVIVSYGVNIRAVAANLVNNVKYKVEEFTGFEIDKIARDYIDARGYAGRFGHGLGHSLGIDIHEDPRLSQNCRDVLKAGVVITVEPGVYLPGVGGVRIENTCLVRENDCTPLTTADKQLIIL